MQRVTLFLGLLLALTVGVDGQPNAPVTDVVVPTAVAPEPVPTAPGPPVTVPGPLPLGTPSPITPAPESQSIQMVITVPTNAPPSPTNSVAPGTAPVAAPAAVAESPGQPTDYTVKSGDSLWKIGRKFGVPVDAILLANAMKSDRLQIGQVLKIPPKQAKTAPGVAAPAPAAANPLQPGQYMVRQGDTLWDIARAHDVAVQDLREANKLRSNSLQIGQILTIPQRNATGSGGRGGRKTTKQPAVPSPLVTPPPDAPTPPPQPPPQPNPTPPQPSPPRTPQPVPQPSPLPITPPNPVPEPQPAPLPLPPGAQLDHGRGPNGNIAAAIFKETDSLVDRRIRYAQRWRPPGERQAWVMDCSNTSRYLYRRVAGIDIGRTASDQYYFLNQRRLAWRIPGQLQGDALIQYLAQRMQPGDLLFWEHTYKPKRNPPVTHVMVYLGRNRGGDLLMAGSQSHGSGRDTRIVGGPDIYVFDPGAPAGGYSTWLGLGHVKGRFVAFGRPLGLQET